ncbi:MAG TPA: hypothetical protein ENJ09_06015 [Planctomycetes bacterium]|nr:hypothetical protein [Planctomycetota bacterium]
MDLNEYWQENKRFVVGVTAGTILFFVGHMVVNSVFAGDIRARKREIARHRTDLAKPMLTSSDLADAEQENEALVEAVRSLVEAVDFQPREEFRLDASRGAANTQYLRVLSRVREELLTRANRAGVKVEPALGMPSLSPTREAEIQRYLEALDVIERTVDLAVRARADRVERIAVRLDPGLTSKQGIGALERTRVKLEIVGDSLALERVLAWTQRPPTGSRQIAVDELELLPSRGKEDEVHLELTLLVPRVSAEVRDLVNGEDA